MQLVFQALFKIVAEAATINLAIFHLFMCQQKHKLCQHKK